MGRSGSGRSRSGGRRGDPRGVRRALDLGAALDPAGPGCCPGSRQVGMLPRAQVKAPAPLPRHPSALQTLPIRSGSHQPGPAAPRGAGT